MRRAHFSVLWTVAAAFAAFSASPLAAEVIVYDNSGAIFQWMPDHPDSPLPPTYLDITLPPTQSGAATNLSIKKRIIPRDPFPFGGPWDVDRARFEMQPGAKIARLDWFIFAGVQDLDFPTGWGISPPRPFAPTQTIDETTGLWQSTPIEYDVGPLKPLTHYATIGVRLTLPDGVHFGWIRIERADGLYFPLAWAYETLPGVPIIVEGLGGTPDADGILHVPEEYPAIRTAMNHAAPGQQVVLADGVYADFDNAPVDFYGKAVMLRSANGPSKCILLHDSPWQLPHRGVEFHSGEGRGSVLDGLTIRGFSVSYPGAGGGIVAQSGPTIINCILQDNTTDDTADHPTYGGAIAASDALIVNCLFVGNTGPRPVAAGGSTIINSTFVDNSGPETVSGGPTLTNCVVFDNFSGVALSSGVTASYSCIEGGWPGIGNISSDPLFVDASAGDYRLAAGSPCIDAASNPAVPGDVTEDLDGNPRFVDDPATIDTGLGRAPIVDMGAFEFQLPLDPADLDQDGDVDGFDLAQLLGQWTGAASYAPCPPHAPADLNSDCKINAIDLALLLGAWG